MAARQSRSTEVMLGLGAAAYQSLPVLGLHRLCYFAHGGSGGGRCRGNKTQVPPPLQTAGRPERQGSSQKGGGAWQRRFPGRACSAADAEIEYGDGCRFALVPVSRRSSVVWRACRPRARSTGKTRRGRRVPRGCAAQLRGEARKTTCLSDAKALPLLPTARMDGWADGWMWPSR